MSLAPSGSSVDKEAVSFETETSGSSVDKESTSFENDVRLPVSLRQPSRDAASDLCVCATRATVDMSG